METLILWAAGVALLAVTFFLSLLYASFAACSISRLEAIAAERRRLGRAKRLIPQLHRLTASLLVLKYLTELGLVAIILLGPLLHPLTGEAGTALHVAIDLAAAAAVIVVICELIPHSIAELRGEQIVLSLGGVAQTLSFVAAPGIWLDRFIVRSRPYIRGGMDQVGQWTPTLCEFLTPIRNALNKHWDAAKRFQQRLLGCLDALGQRDLLLAR